ncbi:hypothetical protein CR513_61193, partial [Mucuna pruriens]
MDRDQTLGTDHHLKGPKIRMAELRIVGRTPAQHSVGLPLLPQFAVGETPYQLTYRTNTMICVEINEPSLRRSSFDASNNPSSLMVDLNLVEEAREQECVRKIVCRQWATADTTSRSDLETLTKMTWYGKGLGMRRRKRKMRNWYPIG